MKATINQPFQKRYMNSKKKPGEWDIDLKPGTEIAIVSDHGNVAIAEHRGERFTIKKEFINESNDN